MKAVKKIVIVVIILGVVGGIGYALYTGMVDPNELKSEARAKVYQARGAANRAMQAPKGDPQSAAACRENLKRIESSKRHVASERGIMAGAVSRDDVVKNLGGVMPTCPSGGEYSINELGRMPSCSVGSAGTSNKEDDHAILTF